jgi:hypothetical protein
MIQRAAVTRAGAALMLPGTRFTAAGAAAC